MATEFRILGPLEVIEDGTVLELGAQKQRTVLAVLLLHANAVVSTDRLIDAVWEDDPPARADKALQVYVSHLRKVVGKERLLTRAPGYVLTVADGELDLSRFESLLSDGRPRDALALWRGPPLADVGYSRFAQPAIARLEELRVAALEACLDEDLAAGRYTQLIGELDRLVREYPIAGAPARTADARPVPRGPPGGRARGLPAGPPPAVGRAWARAGRGAEGSPARDSRP